ncbi:MAG: sulfatase [bacterium]|nr:sulfatase [bacterium]
MLRFPRLAFALLLAPLAPAAAETGRPNILLFLVDDLGWQDVSVPFHTEKTPFNARYHTPHLERLAARGLKFTQAYASAPVCTPTRTSLMTGQSPARTGITYWTLHKDRDQSAKHASVRAPKWNVNALQKDDVTLARLLQSAGYRTIHAGKAHLGARGTSGADPRNLGFDVNIAGHAAGGPGSFYGEHDFSAKHRGGGAVWDVPGLEAYHGSETFLTEALAREAALALDDAVEDEQPFFLHFAPYAVHAPIMANARYLERYAGLDEREAAYATMIETVDAALGALIARVEHHGLTDETIVIFTSDNGGLSAHARGGERHTHNAPLRSGKGSAYEGGVRVPQVLVWPGVTRSGTATAVPVVTHDLFPTVLAMANVATPEEYAPSVEGLDLGPLLRGDADALGERALFWHMPHFWGVHGPGIHPYSAIRKGEWKLLYFHAGTRFELYDLDADLGETRDVAGSRPEVVRALAAELGAWCEAARASMSIDTETGRAIELPHRVGR